MALAGKEYVRKHFLTPRLLRDWLVLFNDLDGRRDRPGREPARKPPSRVSAHERPAVS